MSDLKWYCRQRFACMCSSGLEALNFPFSTMFIRSTDLRFTTSPAIATYTLLPAGLPSFVSLYPLSILSFLVIVCCFCLAVCWCIFIFLSVGKFLKTILLWVGKASSFAIFGMCVGLCELQMCLLLAWAFLWFHKY